MKMKVLLQIFLYFNYQCFLTTGASSSDLLPSIETCGISAVNISDHSETVTKSELQEFPWLVMLEYSRQNQSGFYCGGAIINNRYILTAANCIKSIPDHWDLVSVRLGEYNTSTNPDCTKINEKEICSPDVINIRVTEKIIHEGYELKNYLHDIALLRLENEIEFTDYIKPICLPLTHDLLNTNFTQSNLVVGGWGKPHNKNISSDVLLKLMVTVKSNKKCGEIYNGSVTITDGQICAGGVKNEDLCRGVGGSALMSREQFGKHTNWYAIGLVSFGPLKCGLENWPNIYTRVTNYVPWIISQLKP